ncbi:MAG: hypothetical protein ACR2MF_09685, partial [Chthoniobacterales bacterium]
NEGSVLSNQNHHPMKTSLITPLMVLGFAAAGMASPADTELRALEQQWFDAYVNADTAFLKH